MDKEYELQVREAAFAWLEGRDPSKSLLFRYEDVALFAFGERIIPLLDRQRGIRKPRHMGAALSIRTKFTPLGETPPYDDAIGPDGLLRYKYRGTDPAHPENAALRAAFRFRLPLIWFLGAKPGAYWPVYPVWIVDDHPQALEFTVAVDPAQTLIPHDALSDKDGRSYVERLTKQRVHQPLFRVQVLEAYDHQCAICRLRYDSLLDAAHILPDGHPRGKPVITNGLSLCKIHHAAYDQQCLGVRPDFTVVVRHDIQEAHDGPMLLHGLQRIHGTQLTLPRSRTLRPDPEALEERYHSFMKAEEG